MREIVWFQKMAEIFFFPEMSINDRDNNDNELQQPKLKP